MLEHTQQQPNHTIDLDLKDSTITLGELFEMFGYKDDPKAQEFIQKTREMNHG